MEKGSKIGEQAKCAGNRSSQTVTCIIEITTNLPAILIQTGKA